MNRITCRLHGELGEPDDVAIRLPSGTMVFPNPKWDIWIGVGLARLADIEDVIGEEYDLTYIRTLIKRGRAECDRCDGTGSVSQNGILCQECGSQLKVASAEIQGDDGATEAVIGYCETCGSSFRWKRRIELAKEYNIERYFIG